jgi:hypothetical protein
MAVAAEQHSEAIRGAMTMLKVQTCRPDTHPGHIVEVEWEYDIETGRDTGREHRGVSVRYPARTFVATPTGRMRHTSIIGSSTQSTL